jgi:hypothetical protein
MQAHNARPDLVQDNDTVIYAYNDTNVKICLYYEIS